MNISLSDFIDTKRAEESPIELDGSVVGWHVVLYDAEGRPSGGGLNVSKETARRIATAEFAERKLIKMIPALGLANEFKINEFPTSCGFAAGFEREKTLQRSVAEAIERWCWSKWIDEKYSLRELKLDSIQLSPISNVILKHFTVMRFFHKEISCDKITGMGKVLHFGVTIGEQGLGIFPGSRVAESLNSLWEHSIIESWRHLKIHEANKARKPLEQPFDRIVKFGEHGIDCLGEILAIDEKNWPAPELQLQKELKTGVDGLFCFRSLPRDFVGWHVGDKDRFVY